MSSVANRPAPWTTILSIDDQPANLDVLVDCLTQHGHHVITATSGTEGLEKSCVVRPDLILLDLHMPGGIDGFETCRLLKDNVSTSDIPVIFMTSSDSREDRLRGFASGGVDYLTKPLDPPEVLARIRSHIALSNLRRTLANQNSVLRKEVVARERAQEELRLLASEVRQTLINSSAALESASSAMGAMIDAAADARSPLLGARSVLGHAIDTLNNALAAATMLSSGAPGPMAESDLDRLVEQVMLDLAFDQRERVVVERQATARSVKVQPALMRLALCNLLTHALTVSPPTSKVTLKLADTDKGQAIVFEVSDEGQRVDKGTGGSNARSIDGSGTGLHIVDRVVDLHHGQIEFVPSPANGNIARITIPQGIEI